LTREEILTKTIKTYVQIMMDQLVLMFGDCSKVEEQKLERLKQRLGMEEE